jgi:hypothetical protein
MMTPDVNALSVLLTCAILYLFDPILLFLPLIYLYLDPMANVQVVIVVSLIMGVVFWFIRARLHPTGGD